MRNGLASVCFRHVDHCRSLLNECGQILSDGRPLSDALGVSLHALGIPRRIEWRLNEVALYLPGMDAIANEYPHALKPGEAITVNDAVAAVHAEVAQVEQVCGTSPPSRPR